LGSTFVDPGSRRLCHECRGERADRQEIDFDGGEWLYFPPSSDVAMHRARRRRARNLTYEHEGAYLGVLDQAMAAHNNGGIVIAQVKRVGRRIRSGRTTCVCRASSSTISCEVPEQWQTTQTPMTRRFQARSSGRCRHSRSWIGVSARRSRAGSPGIARRVGR